MSWGSSVLSVRLTHSYALGVKLIHIQIVSLTLELLSNSNIHSTESPIAITMCQPKAGLLNLGREWSHPFCSKPWVGSLTLYTQMITIVVMNIGTLIMNDDYSRHGHYRVVSALYPAAT